MFRGNDILKIYDENFNNIGTATREEVHTKGLLHQVAHVWMYEKRNDGSIYIFFQKRSADRELYPGKYDLIQTTHFDPDESYEDGIVHSLDVYRGFTAEKADLIHAGSIRQKIDHDNYHDNALVQVFILPVKKALFFMPDAEEIVKVLYQDFMDMAHGKIKSANLYTLDDSYMRKSSIDEWWIRKDEYLDIVEPYFKEKNNI